MKKIIEKNSNFKSGSAVKFIFKSDFILVSFSKERDVLS